MIIKLTREKNSSLCFKTDRIFCGESEEEAIRHVCRKAIDNSHNNGCRDIAFDLDTFVENPDDIPYVTSVLIEELSDIAKDGKFNDITVSLLSVANAVNKELISELDKTLSEPVLETVNQSFGAYNDPLKGEFEEFQKTLANEKLFREYLVDLMDRKGIRKYSEVYKSAGVSKSTFSKIINFSIKPPYKPSKETVAALCIGLKLNLAEADEFYDAAGYHLGKTEFIDKAVRFFIHKGIYKIYDVNLCMIEYGYPLLGEKPRKEKPEIKIE